MNLLFVYNNCYDKEVADFRLGKVPTHRLWGYADVERLGHTAMSVEEPRRWREWLLKPQVWRIYQALQVVFRQRRLDAVVAVMETAALPLLVARRLGILRRPLVVINMALLHQKNVRGSKKRLWRWLLPGADAIISLARPHLDWVAEEFGLKRVRQHFIPMLVDTEFFRPDPKAKIGNYCLSVGTNEGKDFVSLLKAWPKGERLLIVTDAYNAEIARQHLEPGASIEILQAVPIERLRTFYREAKLHVIPLANVRLGSGHTVLLENMAMGKVLIVSDAPAMRDYLEDGVNAIVVEPHNVEQLGEKIRSFLAAPEEYAPVGQKAAEWARDHFSSEKFATQLLEIVESLAARDFARRSAEVQQQQVS